ncbi:MAG: helix-turn-helix domain-containing protein, partial [Flavobacteriaceae bacterium]|nr:helix-turn-helix domain-containing protein [Candidatus Onthonaster equi]
MSQNYTRLTLQERFKIEKYLDQKLSISSIAVLLNRNKSTISREV